MQVPCTYFDMEISLYHYECSDMNFKGIIMKNSKALVLILFVAGVMLSFFGGFAAFFPEAYTGRHDISILGNVNLYNEFRGTGGLMLASGLLILLGAFIKELAYTATIVAAVNFLLFALARVFSIFVDGVPVDGIIRATAVEMLVGLICTWAFFKYRNVIKAKE